MSCSDSGDRSVCLTSIWIMNYFNHNIIRPGIMTKHCLCCWDAVFCSAVSCMNVILALTHLKTNQNPPIWQHLSSTVTAFPCRSAMGPNILGHAEEYKKASHVSIWFPGTEAELFLCQISQEETSSFFWAGSILSACRKTMPYKSVAIIPTNHIVEAWWDGTRCHFAGQSW